MISKPNCICDYHPKEELPMDKKISSAVIHRMPRYFRHLCDLQDAGITRISSGTLAERMGLTASQVRQDFNCFGGFGQQGYGYNVAELRAAIAGIMRIDRDRRAIIVGAGNLGKAIAMHINFETRGCHLMGIFDINPKIIGEQVAGISIMHTDEIENFCKEHSPTIAVLCTPKENTQEIANKLISLGIKAFWNFSHYDLSIDHDNIVVENVHLGDSLLTLTYGANIIESTNEQ